MHGVAGTNGSRLECAFLIAGLVSAALTVMQAHAAQGPSSPSSPLQSTPVAAAPQQSLALGTARRNEDAIYQKAIVANKARFGRMGLVTDQILRQPPASDWLIWRRVYDGSGYSPLDQIRRGNVHNLQAAWSWSLPPSPNQITPLVHEGVLFISSANRVQAVDAATGDLLWQHVRPLSGPNSSNHVARNLAIYENKLFVTTFDRHLVALDWRNGSVIWDREIVPPNVVGARLTGGPVVADGKVIQGVSLCNDLPGGCYIVALDAATGAQQWRFNTIARPGEPGGDTWNRAPLEERFGAGVWTSGTYDPALNLLYFGVGQTYNTATLLVGRNGASEPESNDALYTDSTVALDPRTGRLVWHFQHLRRDVWDLDWGFERTLVDLTIDGVPRKLLLTVGKLGIFDVLDRATGTYVFSRDLGLQTLVSRIDPVSGAKTIDPKFSPAPGTKEICPDAGGVRNWPATAYNPRSQVLYVPIVENCMDFSWQPRDAQSTASGGMDFRFAVKPRPGSDGNFGRVEAVDLRTRRTLWTQRQRAPQSSAILVTAGGLVFEGGRDRVFRALEERSGRVLWQTRLSAVPNSFPITYAVDGRQYVAVVAGGGGPIDTSWQVLTPEIENPAGVTLSVFALPRQSK